MAWDSPTDDTVWLATGTQDRLVQVWTLDRNGQLHSVFSVQLDVTVPRGVAFVENMEKDIYVFGLYDRNLYVCPALMPIIPDNGILRHILRGSDGKVVSTQDVGTVM